MDRARPRKQFLKQIADDVGAGIYNEMKRSAWERSSGVTSWHSPIPLLRNKEEEGEDIIT